MKVLCIRDSPDFAHTRNGVVPITDSLKVKCGEIYTVKKEVVGYGGERKFVLVEKPSNCRYKKEYFSPLFSDEVELEVCEMNKSK